MVKEPGDFTEEQGRCLLRLARFTIMRHLNLSPPPAEEEELAVQLADPAFEVKRGIFVTLTIGGALRGCIGSLAAYESVRQGVQRHAVNAAFNDQRFPPLTVSELPEVDIEISVLTEPRPLQFSNVDELPTKLRPGIDGVILRRGTASATFLPQVWEQLPQVDEFMRHLCLKAGLAPEAWRQSGCTIETYQVQHFL
ncbi:MAG TPA: AmmeMemoRadiSam system protein A [Desulfobacterales bacterium]|nr:AmmeMemoRadiSam system protein A [Desulfobacterales bacterium]